MGALVRPLAAALATGVVAVLCVPASSAATATADLSASVASWDVAAARLGTAGSLWEPRHTAGLARHGKVTVVGTGITVADGAVTGGSTFAGAQYGRRGRTVVIEEKWAGTGWAAKPAATTSRALVRTVRIAIGSRGARTIVPARVYADCAQRPDGREPRVRCTTSDVRLYGGTIEFTAKPPSTMSAPGSTTIVIRSTGLRFAELVAVARSVEQVAGAPAGGAGSAQMIGMCRQMVTAPMSAVQAEQFAVSNGYSLRVGSIDGQPQAVTADYRPDRFTVSVTADAVTACTYG